MAKLHLIDYRKVLGELGEAHMVGNYNKGFSFSNFLSGFLSTVPKSYGDTEKENM